MFIKVVGHDSFSRTNCEIWLNTIQIVAINKGALTVTTTEAEFSCYFITEESMAELLEAIGGSDEK